MRTHTHARTHARAYTHTHFTHTHTHTHKQAEAALQASQTSAAEAAAVRERAFHLAQTGATRVALPFGVTLLAGAWKDEWLVKVAQAMQDASGLGCGPEGHMLV